MVELPSMEDVQRSVNATLWDEATFEAGDIQEDFPWVSVADLNKQLQELCKNGPPGGKSDDVKIMALGNVNSRHPREVMDVEPQQPSNEALMTKVAEVFAASKSTRDAGQDFTFRQIYDALDTHFEVDVRKLGLKSSIKEKVRALAAAENRADAAGAEA